MKTSKTVARFVLPALGLLTALASTGCGADAEQGVDADALLVDGETSEAAQALLLDTIEDRSKIITGLTDEREGWGKDAVGGKGGSIYRVTSLIDSGNAGSLRYALERPSSEKLWIIFDVQGTITLNSPIGVKSNKTVDARNRAITIKTVDNETTGFGIEDQHDIVLINLRFDNDWPSYTSDSEGADAITIVSSHDIWIHHCEFMEWSDGAVDMKEGTYNVSVTWSRFQRLYQAMLWDGDMLSLGHSVCDSQVNARCPKIIGGKAHSYNNYITGWTSEAIQNAKGGGQLFSERNIFEGPPVPPGGFNNVNKRDDPATDKIENDDHYEINPVNFVGGDDAVSGTFKSQSHANAKLVECSNVACWTDMKARLLSGDSTHKAAGSTLFGL